MFDNTSIAIMYAVTPCHAGSGSALGVVDLPIQRERHTNWPMIQASGVKGAFRANFERFKDKISEDKRSQIKQFDDLTKSIFGHDKGVIKDDKSDDEGKEKPINPSGFAGSVSISDARILAYPMRSNVSPFVWITCPSVLKRFARDLNIAGFETFDASKFDVKDNIAKNLCNYDFPQDVLLEDFEVKVLGKGDSEFEKVKKYFVEAERLLLVSDEVFNYGVTDCTQIMAQIKIDQSTGTTATGSLRYQEELPADTIMYTVIHWGDSKSGEKLKADIIKKFITEQVVKAHIQIAGDETCGRGIFELNWHSPKQEGATNAN